MIPGCPHSDIVALSLRSKETVPTPTFGLKAKPCASHLLKVIEEQWIIPENKMRKVSSLLVELEDPKSG